MNDILLALSIGYMIFAMWYLFGELLSHLLQTLRWYLRHLESDLFSAIAALEMAQLARLMGSAHREA